MKDYRMAMLVLLWQEACLEHAVENDELLPGALSATKAEEKVLDSVQAKEYPDLDWDDFNKAYSSFLDAKSRTEACLKILKETSYEIKVQVVRYLFDMANASTEDNSEHSISDAEASFILNVKQELGVSEESII